MSVVTKVRGRIYSVGYEGFTQHGFVEAMSQSSVDVVVDVRLNAVSRRAGFSKRGLKEALELAGVAYVHEPGLGNPLENRDSFRNGDGTAGRRRIEKMLANGSGEALGRVVELARSKRIAILCVERDPGRCHRAVITDAICALEPELEVLPVL
jgi:uncharacterized protein (DUF488 family)